jgi:hypothetical protein
MRFLPCRLSAAAIRCAGANPKMIKQSTQLHPQLLKRAAQAMRKVSLEKEAGSRWRTADGLRKILARIPPDKLRDVSNRSRALPIAADAIGVPTGKGLAKLQPEIDGMRNVLPRMVRQEQRMGGTFQEPTTLYRGTRFMDPLTTRTRNSDGELVALASPLWSVAHRYAESTELGRVLTVLKNRRGKQKYAPDYSHRGFSPWSKGEIAKIREQQRNSQYGNFWDREHELAGYGPRTTQDVLRSNAIEKYHYETPITKDNPVVYRTLFQGSWTDAVGRRLPNNPKWDAILRELTRDAPKPLPPRNTT